jgi:hypothetical protein
MADAMIEAPRNIEKLSRLDFRRFCQVIDPPA